jgi:hypothetical protein
MGLKVIRMSLLFDISLMQLVIPGLTKPALYLIRGNPVRFWILGFALPAETLWATTAGMMHLLVIDAAVHRFIKSLDLLRDSVRSDRLKKPRAVIKLRFRQETHNYETEV